MPSPPRRFWRDVLQPERRQLRAFYRSLETRLGPFKDLLVVEHARLTAESWWAAVYASGAALDEIGKRQRGRGRRPTLQAVDRRLKRAGLGAATHDQMLRRLEELTGKNGHGPGSPEDLMERLRRAPVLTPPAAGAADP